MRFRYSQRKRAEVFANCEDPDQMPHSVASDLGLHCLPNTLLGVSLNLKLCIHIFISTNQYLPSYN